ncbi:MAG: DUF3368 domain-containing protein [Thiotrichales bacterium]|nr:DUF3368 domain-containing protein [Thiotrichales bacterium]
MIREVVADTGPLIALARVGEIDLLRRLYGRIVVPPAVYTELALDSARPGAKVLAGVFATGWITVETVADSSVRWELDQLLDPGEAEAIAFAEQREPSFLLIDDARGRRTARSRGVPVVGVAGVLLVAKSRGEIAAVGPVLKRLSDAGYRLSPRLVAAMLAKAGERATELNTRRTLAAADACQGSSVG